MFPKRRRGLPGLAAPYELQGALAVRAPVAAADNAWSREWIEDGSTGLLAEAGNVEALAQAAIRILEDPALARRLADAGHRALAGRAAAEVVDPDIVALLRAEESRAAA
jgi:glycosyltransferase involved in cell wall biosynthesis